MEVIAKTFNPLWRAKNGFKIQSFGDHKILFIFDNMEDVDRILEGEPWTFDKHLVVMNRYENESSLQDIKFEKTKLWVQLHGLPIKYITIEAAKKIGSVLGEVYVPMNPKFFDGGHFVRIQVSIDSSLPLCRGRLVSIDEGGKQVWVAFKYERLPNICYWCGRLTHDDRDCDCGLIVRVPSNQNNVSLGHTCEHILLFLLDVMLSLSLGSMQRRRRSDQVHRRQVIQARNLFPAAEV